MDDQTNPCGLGVQKVAVPQNECSYSEEDFGVKEASPSVISENKILQAKKCAVVSYRRILRKASKLQKKGNPTDIGERKEPSAVRNVLAQIGPSRAKGAAEVS